MKKKRKNYLSITSDFDAFTKKIEECKSQLEESSFYSKMLASLDTSFEAASMMNVTVIICYGLGSFTRSVSSRYQLALLLLLKDHLEVDVEVYDPVFSEIEVNFINKLGLNMIEKNEKAMRCVNSPTFIFMPHCPSALMNNFLWSNWLPGLSSCVILGNSFTGLSEALSKSESITKYQYIFDILPVTREFPIVNDFKFTDIFNDLALHVFPRNLLNELSSSFWENAKKPVYDSNIIESISFELSEISAVTSKML